MLQSDSTQSGDMLNGDRELELQLRLDDQCISRPSDTSRPDLDDFVKQLQNSTKLDTKNDFQSFPAERSISSTFDLYRKPFSFSNPGAAQTHPLISSFSIIANFEPPKENGAESSPQRYFRSLNSPSKQLESVVVTKCSDRIYSNFQSPLSLDQDIKSSSDLTLKRVEDNGNPQDHSSKSRPGIRLPPLLHLPCPDDGALKSKDETFLLSRTDQGLEHLGSESTDVSKNIFCMKPPITCLAFCFKF